MDINYYLTVGNCALFANVLKVELSKELTDEQLNNFFKNDFEDVLRRIHDDIIVNGRDNTDVSKGDIYIEIWESGKSNKDVYTISVNLTNKDGVKKGMQFDNVRFVLQSNYRYHEFMCSEPLILDHEDWNKDEWKTILNLFGMQEADRIKVTIRNIEAFGIRKGE